MRQAGFLDEYDVLEMWPLSEDNFHEFLDDNDVPFVPIKGKHGTLRVFHVSQLVEWFCKRAQQRVDERSERRKLREENDQSSRGRNSQGRRDTEMD